MKQKMSVQGVNLALAILVTVTVALPTAEVNPSADLAGIMVRIEERLKGLEVAQARLDMRLQQDASKLDQLHANMDRMEKSINGRALHAQLAAERAANTCQKLHQRITQTTETTQGGPIKWTARAEAVLGIDHPQKTDNDMKHSTMQRDAAGVIAKEAFTITTKMSNMYNDLWRRSLTMEGLLRESLSLTNSTRKDIHDGMRSLAQTVKRSSSPPPGLQCTLAMQAIDHMNNVIERKLIESNHKMDTKFQEVTLAQNLFLESCHRIQLNEPQLEKEISTVLKTLLDSFMNKTATTYKELQTVQDLIKSHDSHIIKALARMNNAAITAIKEHKAMTTSIVEECRKEDMNKKADGLTSFSKKLDKLLTFLQELQDEMTYTESRRTAEVVKSFNAKLILDGITNEIHKAVPNISLSLDSTIYCKDKMKDDERDSLIEKLTFLVESLQDLTVNLEEKEFEEKYDDGDDDSEIEFEDKYNKPMSNITNPKELIYKLNHINIEKSAEGNLHDDNDEDIVEYEETTTKNSQALKQFNLRNIDDFDDYPDPHLIRKRHQNQFELPLKHSKQTLKRRKYFYYNDEET